MNHTEECEICGRPLKEDKIIWLELSITDGNYYIAIPEGHESQGYFPFGSDCAKKAIKKSEK